MPMQNPERVVTKQDLKDFYDAIYPYLGGSFSDLIAHIETDATSASKAYAVGDQLILNNQLYEVTAAIALGDPLTVGTNIALADDITTQLKSAGATTDATPTKNSTNPVQSGGVYTSENGIREIAAPVEEDAAHSSNAYAIGEQLILNGLLYTASAAIAANDPLTVGTNIVLSDDLTTQIAGKMDSRTLDSTPTASSNNLVKSGGVYSTSVTAVAADTASTDGQVKVNYTKGGNNTDVSASVKGWNPLVGKWTSSVTALTSATSVSLTNPFSTSSVDVFPVCQNSSGTPITVTKITATSSTITLTFSALTEQTSFKALVKANV